MKHAVFLLFLSLLLNSCISKKISANDVSFRIIDTILQDSSYARLQISNNTGKNFYFPILNTGESEKWSHMLSSRENRFFFMYPVFYDSSNQKKDWVTENCLSDRDIEMESLDQLWRKKKQAISIKDLLLLKSGENIIIKVPVKVQVKVSENCIWKLSGSTAHDDLKVEIAYLKKEKELALQLLSSETLDSLNRIGYELYESELRSNKVIFRD